MPPAGSGGESCTRGGVELPTCGAEAWPWGEPILLGGTAIVALQRYRCQRSNAHWWDRSTVIADLDAP